jgi:hypothetical protein
MGIASEFFKLLARGAICEKLIFNKEKENMLEKCFKGFIIPPLADTPEGREAVRRGHRGDKDYCFLSDVKCMAHECIEAKRRCGMCIACLNSGDARLKHEAFKEYDRRHPVKGKVDVPRLLCGTVVKLDNGVHYLIEGPAGVPVGEAGDVCIACISHKEKNFGIFINCREVLQSYFPVDRVVAVYGLRGILDGKYAALSVGDLHDILNGKTDPLLLWKKPDPVKEMTVDEISKALGYKVKVVGSEKADD